MASVLQLLYTIWKHNHVNVSANTILATRTYLFYRYSGACDARYAGACYVIVSELLNWQGARSRCEAAGGHLVTIDSSAENDVVYALAVSKFYKELQICKVGRLTCKM